MKHSNLFQPDRIYANREIPTRKNKRGVLPCSQVTWWRLKKQLNIKGRMIGGVEMFKGDYLNEKLNNDT